MAFIVTKKMDCPIAKRPSEDEMKIIREVLPLKELIAKYKFQTGGGYSTSQWATASAMALIITLMVAGVGATGIYYALTYTGLMAYVMPALHTAEAAMQGCGTLGGTTGRWALNKLTLGFVPDCATIHNNFDQLLNQFYMRAMALQLPFFLGFKAMTIKIASIFFAGECATTTHSETTRRKSSSAKTGGSRRRKRSLKKRK